MTLRELQPSTAKSLSQTCEDEFKEWYERTRGRQFGTMEPLTPHDIFRYGYSRGVTATIAYVDKGQFKEEV